MYKGVMENISKCVALIQAAVEVAGIPELARRSAVLPNTIRGYAKRGWCNRQVLLLAALESEATEILKEDEALRSVLPLRAASGGPAARVEARRRGVPAKEREA